MDLRALPKTELHLHLEGAIPEDTFLQLIHKYGDAEEVPDLEGLGKRLAYRDFPHFLATWRWMNAYVREYEDFDAMARGVGDRLAACGVRYAEVFCTPGDFLHHGLTLQGIVLAIRQGLDAVPHAPPIRLIVDLARNRGPEQGAAWLEQVAEVADEAGIAGIGLGGPEREFPPEPYAPVYRRAESLGLHRVAHAGEAAGPASVWGAVLELGAERIGHGVRSVEDPELVVYLADHEIPLEVCPTSNLRTAVVESLEAHPIRRLLEAGVPITLSSDDPTFFGADIVDEYTLLRDALGFSEEELIRVARTGFERAFLAPEECRRMLGEFDADAGRLAG